MKRYFFFCYLGVCVLIAPCTELEAVPSNVFVDTFSVMNFLNTSSAANTNISITNNSVVNFLDSSTSANAIISIDGTSILNFSQISNDIFTGSLSGTGVIYKTTGTILGMTGNSSTFAGQTFVQQGTLALSGILGGNVSVSSALTLLPAVISQLGTVGGNLSIDHGIIDPQNVGTFSVGGNYAQTTNSTYNAVVNSMGQSSLVNIVGAASIAGTVAADTTGGGSRPQAVHNSPREWRGNRDLHCAEHQPCTYAFFVLRSQQRLFKFFI